MKYLVTGFPGSGKSTVAIELNKAGFTACSTDETPGASRFVDQVTKQPVAVPKNASAEWKLRHYWAWDPDKIHELLNSRDIVFICGLSNDQHIYYHLFDKIFVLTIDEATMLKRLATRDTNDFGKHPKERERMVKIRQKVQADLLKNDKSTAIDATQPLKKVVDEILSKLRT